MTGVDSIEAAQSQPVLGNVAIGTPDRTVTYMTADLAGMKVAEIKSLAAELGYIIKATKKDDIIAEFLAQQSERGASNESQ